MRIGSRRSKTILALCLAAAILAGAAWVERIRKTPDPRGNLRILDRRGIPLAQQDNPQFGIRIWVPLGEISPALQQAVLDQEDRHFYSHLGVDPRGLGRALLANLHSGTWNQGGSTITQQLAKLLVEDYRGKPAPRTLFWKTVEALVAFDCELHWSKTEILEHYLNSVYLGHRFYGVEAAAQAYFGKSCRDLTRKEAVTLATHVRRPNQWRPQLSEALPTMLAPHLLAMFSKKNPGPDNSDRVVHSTLDAGFQALAQDILERGIESLRREDPEIQGAVVVIDIPSGELRALVGSEDFGDAGHQGQVNYALAKRQPGSTLKPFTYFLAFLHHRRPADLVLDAPYHFYLGDERSYTPNNFDRHFHGIMPIREALANSLNIPAVLTLEELGTPYYLELLHRFGFLSLDQAPSFYGLALTLGSGEVSLVELTNAYAALARGGQFRPLILDRDAASTPASSFELQASPREREAAFLVTNILSDPEARRRSFGDANLMGLDAQAVAVKTGTSHDSRDAWAVGYTSRYAVGVWAGHSDNSPMPGFTGAEAAIPIWHGVMAGLNPGTEAQAFPIPHGVSQQVFCKDPACEVAKRDWTQQATLNSPLVPQPQESFRFITPVDGDHFLLDPQLPKERQQVFCEVRLPAELKESAKANGWPLRWSVDGKEVAASPWDQSKTFLQLPPGKHQLSAAVGEKKTRLTRLTVSEI